MLWLKIRHANNLAYKANSLKVVDVVCFLVSVSSRRHDGFLSGVRGDGAHLTWSHLWDLQPPVAQSDWL